MRENWILTEQDEAVILAMARYNKIKKLEWLAKANPIKDYLNDVELTEDEKESALVVANKSKAWNLQVEAIKAESRHKAKLAWEEEVAKWNYGYFFKTMKDQAYMQGSELIFNDQTSRLIKTICFKMARDMRYETEMGFRFDRGLIIRGEPGLGKTWITGLVADNPVNPVQMVTMHEIQRSVLDTGAYNGLRFASFSLVYLDDVGTEGGDVTYYGTKINWFKTWFEEIYAKSKNALSRVMISTNCSFDQIESLYGFRVRDRMAEMFDVIDVDGKSMRRK